MRLTFTQNVKLSRTNIRLGMNKRSRLSIADIIIIILDGRQQQHTGQ